jgi:hypothetical protein
MGMNPFIESNIHFLKQLKLMKRNFLLLVVCALFALNAAAQDKPVAGQQFRIQNGSGLYLTTDPDWSPAEGDWIDGTTRWPGGAWNLGFLDSLYTTPVTQEYTLAYTGRDPETITLNTAPEKQIFTLRQPDPNDPEIWALEAFNGQFFAADLRNTWDITLAPYIDDAVAHVNLLDQGWEIYLIKFTGHSNYVASDAATEGISIGKYADGWEYAQRSFLYRDKPATQANDQALWYFEKAETTAIPTVIADKNLSVSVVNGLLKVNKENGTPIAIYSITGSKVLETTLQGTVNLDRLNTGVYIVATPSGEKAKFIK